MEEKNNWNPRKIACSLLCLVLCAALLLSACAKNNSTAASAEITPVTLPDTITAEGHLEPVTSTWLSFQASGRVEEMLVKEGDKITAGEALVQLEGSERAKAALTAAQSALYLAKLNLDDATTSSSLKSAAELKLATAQRAYNNALGNYNNRSDTQGNTEQIGLYNAEVTIAQDKVDTLQKRLDQLAEMDDSDVVKANVIAALNQAKLDLDAVKKLRDYFQDLPDNLDVQTLTAKLDVAKAALDDAKRDYDRFKDGPSKEALAPLQAAADTAQASVDDAQWAYDQLVLRAPYDGTFVQCGLTKGQFVTPGVNVALVADFSSWLIETDDLDEEDEAQIDTSKPVSITADALPGKTFSGTVERVLQSYTNKNGDILYTAKVKLDNSDPKLMWGMTMQLEFQK